MTQNCRIPDEVVLVVIDDELVLKLCERALPAHFNEIYFALNPDEATEHLINHRITHLVVDYDLGNDETQQPYPDGYTLARGWIRDYSNIKHAIIFTGEGPEYPHLFDISVIHKPIKIVDLVQAIRSPLNIVRVVLNGNKKDD
ncbi:MAG: response regulator [Deltaproteobacteria bacterium]|nr:response regulator [Deltaproteobacteria bacterium]